VSRAVTLGDGRRVTLGSYVRVVKLAKANPNATFQRDLLDRWPAKGADIVRQFRRGMADRINDAISYSTRGTK